MFTFLIIDIKIQEAKSVGYTNYQRIQEPKLFIKKDYLL